VPNFSGNAVATLLIGKWVGEIDRERAQLMLDGSDPFDEATMIADEKAPQLAEHPLPGHERFTADGEATPAASTGALPVGSRLGQGPGRSPDL
jgi:aerobic C4-dicarboxylate transport protein